MRFDTIVTGGGLSGLVSAIVSQHAGRRTAIVSAGQSALHFWSGSFEFLGNLNGKTVKGPLLEAVAGLPDSHPYRRIGAGRLDTLLSGVAPLLEKAGLIVNGSLDHNHERLTPLGFFKPAWLTLDDYAVMEYGASVPWNKVAIVNIKGYIDFYPSFLAHGLRGRGVECTFGDVDTPRLDQLRRSTTEMRATNISRFLNDAEIDQLARQVNAVSKGVDAVIMPAVIGMFSDRPLRRFRQIVDVPVYFVPTMPASVPGVRCQLALRDYFIRLGGTFMPGDTVVGGHVEGHRLHRLYTANMGDMPLEADNFVISTGSFFGHGLIATMERICEPVLDLDVKASEGRTSWYDTDFYASQPYMGFGVDTDSEFHPLRKGEPVENLYATGALLSGFNALKEGSGAGITLATALHAAERIIKS